MKSAGWRSLCLVRAGLLQDREESAHCRGVEICFQQNGSKMPPPLYLALALSLCQSFAEYVSVCVITVQQSRRFRREYAGGIPFPPAIPDPRLVCQFGTGGVFRLSRMLFVRVRVCVWRQTSNGDNRRVRLGTAHQSLVPHFYVREFARGSYHAYHFCRLIYLDDRECISTTERVCVVCVACVETHLI